MRRSRYGLVWVKHSHHNVPFKDPEVVIRANDHVCVKLQVSPFTNLLVLVTVGLPVELVVPS